MRMRCVILTPTHHCTVLSMSMVWQYAWSGVQRANSIGHHAVPTAASVTPVLRCVFHYVCSKQSCKFWHIRCQISLRSDNNPARYPFSQILPGKLPMLWHLRLWSPLQLLVTTFHYHCFTTILNYHWNCLIHVNMSYDMFLHKEIPFVAWIP